MKYISLTLISIIFLLSACEKEENEVNKTISPPEWVQGDWISVSPQYPDLVEGYRIKDDDVCKYYDWAEHCLTFQTSQEGGSNDYGISETFGDSEYSVTLIENGVAIQTQRFVLRDDALVLIKSDGSEEVHYRK